MIMKRLIAIIVLAIMAEGTVLGQQYDALDQVRNDWRKAAGMEGPHRFDAKAPLSKAPKGYKPFYIDHYGRHGSRYAWNSQTYQVIHEVLTKADAEAVLTPLGKEFYQKYEDFYEIPFLNTGYLTQLGFDQHRQIAEFIYDSFPKVFKDGKRVDALSSTSQRCIVSMGSFCLGLKGRNPELVIYEASNESGMDIITPPDGPSGRRHYAMADYDKVNLESSSDFYARTVNDREISDRLFTDPEFLSRNKDMGDFIGHLASFLSGYHNYSEEPIFDGVLTNEQLVSLWEAGNYGSFLGDTRARYSNIPLLQDFIDKAEAAFQDPTRAANLRFGHDYILEAFTCLLNLNGCGTVPDKADEAKYWFQSYNIPMATTVFFVFYRNKSGNIIFKVVWNEEEATLPQLTPVTGCYYNWSDFIAWYDKLLADHPLQK